MFLSVCLSVYIFMCYVYMLVQMWVNAPVIRLFDTTNNNNNEIVIYSIVLYGLLLSICVYVGSIKCTRAPALECTQSILHKQKIVFNARSSPKKQEKSVDARNTVELRCQSLDEINTDERLNQRFDCEVHFCDACMNSYKFVNWNWKRCNALVPQMGRVSVYIWK